MNKAFSYLAAATLVVSTAVSAEESLPLRSVNRANEVIDAALLAHGGAEKLQAMHSFVQESTMVTYGTQQSRLPDPPWDRGAAKSINVIDVDKNIFVNRIAGNGGGFDFHAATIINGADSWQVDVRAATAAPIGKPDFNTTSGPLVRVTAPLLMKQLQQRRQLSHWLGVAELHGRPHDVITLAMEVGPGLSLYFDQDTHMLTAMERVLPPFGQVEYRFTDYEFIDGIAVNKGFHLLLNGEANVDTVNTSIKLNVPVEEFARLDESLQKIPDPGPDDFNLQEIGEGVFLVGGNAAYGLFVEMQDYIIAIGGTQGASARITEMRKHIPDKPIRYGVLTHHHSDHVPGAADYAREGAIIVTFKENETVVRNAIGDEHAVLQFVDGRVTLGDGNRSVELYDIGPTPHAEHFLIAYLPAEKIIFEADHFPLPRSGPVPPAVPATFAFYDAIQRLGLDYRMIVDAHSPRIGVPQDMSDALSRKPALAVGAL